MVFICGKMEKSMKEADKTIKCMEWEQRYGLMGENTVENILKIRNKAMGHLNGRMVKSILVTG